MPIRKGKLWRVCLRCGESFPPSSKTNKVCNKCIPSTQMDKWLKRQTIPKLNKLEMGRDRKDRKA